jgi:prepilin-type N-terminal cleavage/methylation domain-containing protein
MQNTRYKQAFTLIEVLIATVLVGLAVASLVAASGSLTKANAAGVNLSTAEFLIEQLRELTALLPVVDPQTGISTFGPEEAALANYDDLDDFDNSSFSPPINANRQLLNDFAAYTQQVTVQNVSASNFEQVVADNNSSFVRVTVRVFLNASQISCTSWIRARY